LSIVNFYIFELSLCNPLSNLVRFVNDYNSGSKTFLDPAELVLSVVVIDRFARLS